MYRKILVPLDGSKLAESALPHAESLASAYRAGLVLFHVVQPPVMTGRESTELMLMQESMESLKESAEIYLDGLKGVLREKKIDVEAHIGFGPVVRQIVEAADLYKADLVVIASHGRSGLGRVFFGSVASGVLNRIEHPLMVIRSTEG